MTSTMMRPQPIASEPGGPTRRSRPKRQNLAGWLFVGPVIGGTLLAQKMPLSELFAWASTPMIVGAVAATAVATLCYRRFRGFRLNDRAAEPESEAATGTVTPGSTAPGNNGGSNAQKPDTKGFATRFPTMNTRVRRNG